MAEPLILSARASVDGVVCEIKFVGTADAFRGEMLAALARATRDIRQKINERYTAEGWGA